MQLPEMAPPKNSHMNTNRVFFKAREAFIQNMVRNVSQTILGIKYKESLWPPM